MTVYRICKKAFSKKLSGRGAEKAGGKWNNKGVPMIYTCESRALCTTEIAVHIPLGVLPSDYMLLTIDIPQKIKIQEIKKENLPTNWKSFPYADSTQHIGDKFIVENKFAVLKVPSAVVEGDFNYLVNPNHKDVALIKIIKIESFEFDKRLFKK
jgi:RES domain-containing protein